MPIIHDGKAVGVLDIDSDTLNSFDETDAFYLEAICQRLAATYPANTK